eukprot:359467-Chlamydomonas_euryale.AAC.1
MGAAQAPPETARMDAHSAPPGQPAPRSPAPAPRRSIRCTHYPPAIKNSGRVHSTPCKRTPCVAALYRTFSMYKVSASGCGSHSRMRPTSSATEPNAASSSSVGGALGSAL